MFLFYRLLVSRSERKLQMWFQNVYWNEVHLDNYWVLFVNYKIALFWIFYYQKSNDNEQNIKFSIIINNNLVLPSIVNL